MKKMWKKLLFTTLSMLFAFMIFYIPSEAAEVKTVGNYMQKDVTYKRDITGDNKKDTIKFDLVKPSKNSYEVYKLNVYVNGKKALTINPAHEYPSFSVKYIKMSKTKKFLQIYATGDNDYPILNGIYKYNNKTKKLVRVLNLNKYPLEAHGVTSATSSQIKVKFMGQPAETGWIECKFTFTYKNGSFKLKSNTTTVKSLFAKSGYSYDPDGYGKYFKENKFKTSKKLKFYTTTSLKKVSFTAKKGTVLKLKKIKMVNSKVYLQFQYGNKTGWRKVFNDNVYDFTLDDWEDVPKSGWFYGVYNRLAG